jgi:hypothetical protein
VKQWIQNRGLLAGLLMDGLATIFLICVMAYCTTAHFLGQSDAATSFVGVSTRFVINFWKPETPRKISC